MIRVLALAALAAQLAAAPTAATEFRTGLIALHNFEYEEANAAFLKAQQLDRAFALAYWGEAMTYHQILWQNEDVAAGRRALLRLSPTPEARAAKAATDRDRGLLAAADALFGLGDAAARRAAHAQAMANLYQRFPADPDVASLYALALMGTTARGLAAAVDAHEGHSAALAGSATQTRVTEILERVLRAHPTHPGALHYMLHNHDDPAHARRALPAARAYAKVAPQSSHALHMPAHIFVQLGMWHEAAQSDRAAYNASKAWVTAKGLPPAMRSYHALSWLQYELLQLGRHAEARTTLAELEPVVNASKDLRLLSELASMRARYVIDTGRWDLLARERNFGNVNELFAIGMSAARTGNTSAAELARQGLAQRAGAEQEGEMRPVIAIMQKQVAGLLELSAGRRDRAIAVLREAMDAEQRLPPPLGPPKPVKPAAELLGDVLIEIGRPRDAIAAYQAALQRNANRTASVLGLARAAQASGDLETSLAQYRAVMTNYSGADAALPAVAEARAALKR